MDAKTLALALVIWAGSLPSAWAGNGRLDIALLPSGYTSEATFRADAQKVIDAHHTREPYTSRWAQIGWSVLWTTEKIPCTRSTSMTRLITCDQTAASLVVVNAGVELEKGIVLVNTTSYGGSGAGRFAVSYRGSQMVQVTVHEFGHTLANLKDEYNLYTSNGSVSNTWLGNCWMGATSPVDAGLWSKGCSRPNFWRQRAIKPDGTSTNSVMHSLAYSQFNQVSSDLLIRAIDDWAAR